MIWAKASLWFHFFVPQSFELQSNNNNGGGLSFQFWVQNCANCPLWKLRHERTFTLGWPNIAGWWKSKYQTSPCGAKSFLSYIGTAIIIVLQLHLHQKNESIVIHFLKSRFKDFNIKIDQISNKFREGITISDIEIIDVFRFDIRLKKYLRTNTFFNDGVIFTFYSNTYIKFHY